MSSPSAFSIFKAFYQQRTYLPRVPTSPEYIKQHSLKDDATAKKIQKLISDDVLEIFQKPLTYSIEENTKRCEELKKRDFQLLSSKHLCGKQKEFYSVVSHKDLDGKWILKLAVSRNDNEDINGVRSGHFKEEMLTSPYESYLRVAMRDYLAEQVKKQNIDVVLPKKYFVPLRAYHKKGESPLGKYVIAVEQLDVLSESKTVEAIKSMSPENQRKTAEKCVKLAKLGLADATFDNIRLLKDKKTLVVVDTEPMGTLAIQSPRLLERIYPARQVSLEKSTRIGLGILENVAISKSLLENFGKPISKEYQAVKNIKYSRFKIATSILIPVIPVIVYIASVILSCYGKYLEGKINKVKDTINKVYNKPLKSKTQTAIQERRDKINNLVKEKVKLKDNKSYFFSKVPVLT